MDNHDKIFDQFKNAAENVTPKKFDSMDQVWAKVENKLDQKVLKKENKLLKKIAVAASIFLVVSIGYQFFKTNPKIEIKTNPLVINDSIIKEVLKPKDTKEVIAEIEPIVVQKETSFMTTEPSKNNVVKSNDETINDPNTTSASSPKPILSEISKSEETDAEKEIKVRQLDDFKELKKARSGHFYKGRIFDAIGVYNETEAKTDKPAGFFANKNAPLVVIDGKAITNRANSDKDNGKKVFSDLEDDEIETIVELKEPLYVINGVYYSEEELFGANPTSPYAPLDKQEIETIVILQEKDAVPVYGEKGRKGVVIVSTKNGKPVKK